MKVFTIGVAVLLSVGSASQAHAQATKPDAKDAKVAERAASSRLRGAQDATVTVYEIADFQCPYCGRFAREVFPHIDSAYVKTGKAKWVFINFPLPTHANSWAAAEAAMCTGGTGGDFWEMHEKLYARQSEWAGLANPATTFARYAKESGVAPQAYDACVANDVTASILVRDLLNAAGTGLTGTPAYIVNSDPIFTGYRPLEEWKGILDNALKKASAPAK